MERLTDRESDIFNLLQDQKSKDIFIARHKYTNSDVKFVHSGAVTDLFYDLFEKSTEWEAIMRRLVRGKYILYGAGTRSRRLIRVLKHYGCIDNCLEIWDKNAELKGMHVENIRINTPPTTTHTTKQRPLYDTILVGVAGVKPVELSKLLSIPEDVFIMSEDVLFNDSEQYFDKEIIIPRLCCSEIFVDAGCCDFMNSEYLLQYAPKVEKIIAIEPSEHLMGIIKNRVSELELKNIQCEKCALSSHTGRILNNGDIHVYKDTGASCFVDVCKLDDIVDRVSFIKMDIEGSELDALIGAKETIKKHKPKLAISVYHKKFDYLELPEYVLSLVPDYKLYLRHYRLNSPAETVLYCVE